MYFDDSESSALTDMVILVSKKKTTCRTFSGHAQEVCGLVWSFDGRYLASGGGDNMVKIWEPSSLGAEDPV